MNRVDATPEHLREFAGELRRFNDDLRDRVSGLQAGFTRLGETWRDQQHERFANLFAETTKALVRFIEAGDQHVPYLTKAAEKLEEYLHLR